MEKFERAKKYVCYILIGAVSLLVLVPLVKVIGTAAGMFLVFFYAGKQAEKDDYKLVPNSQFIGKEIKIAPFATVYKMSKYARWRDDYLYVMVGKPTDASSESQSVSAKRDLKGYLNLRVVEVRISASFNRTTQKTCILQNKLSLDEKFTMACQNLIHASQITRLYDEAVSELETTGSAYIALQRHEKDAFRKPIFKVGWFKVYKVVNSDELLSLITQDALGRPYELIFSNLPFHFKERGRVHETRISKIYIAEAAPYTMDIDLSNDGPQEELVEYFQKNELPGEIESWIQTRQPASFKNRWALRVIIMEMQRIINRAEVSETDSKYVFKRHQALRSCLSEIYERDAFLNDFRELEEFYLREPNRLKRWSDLKQLAAKDPIQIEEGGCGRLIAPTAFSEGVIVNTPKDAK